MTAYGVTPTGWVSKDQATISSELDTGLKKILGDAAGSEPDGSIPPSGFAGQLKQFMLDRETTIWELGAAVYSSWDTRANGDASQDATGYITGVARELAKASTVTATCTGDVGTFLGAGRQIRVIDNGGLFATDADATIAALTAWANTTGYVVGDRVTNSGNAYVCITSGTSAGSGGPTTTDADITDGTVHWRYMGLGQGAVDVACTATATGPIPATSGTLTDIATPVAGWRGAINLLDAKVGQNVESNTAFRLRRDAELAAQGNATVNAIRSAVLAVDVGTNDPVTAINVFHNDTDVTDGDGVPPHSVEVLVLGGSDANVAQAIFDSVSAGTGTHGTSSYVVTDSAGNAQTVYFTRPTPVTIWVIADITYDPKTFPTDLTAGSDLLKEQIVFFGDAYPVGRSVRSSAVQAQLFDGNSDALTGPVAGVLDVTSLLIGTTNPPVSSATIAITSREIATFDTSRVTINLTPGTP